MRKVKMFLRLKNPYLPKNQKKNQNYTTLQCYSVFRHCSAAVGEGVLRGGDLVSNRPSRGSRRLEQVGGSTTVVSAAIGGGWCVLVVLQRKTEACQLLEAAEGSGQGLGSILELK